MGKNLYNDTEDLYSNLIKDLKDLPKINTPDNFEYNLMIKIQNGNLEEPKYSTESKKTFWIFAPVTTFAAAAIILFIFNRSVEIENPLMSLPQLRTDLVDGGVVGTGDKNMMKASLFSGTGRFRMVLKPNDAVVTEEVEFPFDQAKSVSLDNFIGNPNSRSNKNINLYQVGGTGSSNSEFNGFYFYGAGVQEELGRLRSRRDSILNMLLKNQNN